LEVTKVFEFDAAHKLCNKDWNTDLNMQKFGKCYNMHGHRYILHVTVEGDPDPGTGMVINFVDLKKIVNEAVTDVLDHSCLNDVIDLPTCERTLPWIKEKLHGRLPNLKRLTLYETPTSYATLDIKEN